MHAYTHPPTHTHTHTPSPHSLLCPPPSPSTTGAGWGGCTVSLLREDQVPAFLAAVRGSYYAPLLAAGRLSEDELTETLFASRPSAGAALVDTKAVPVPADA